MMLFLRLTYRDLNTNVTWWYRWNKNSIYSNQWYRTQLHVKKKEFLLTAQNNNIRPVAAKPLKEQEFTIFMKDGQNIQTHLESTKYTHWL